MGVVIRQKEKGRDAPWWVFVKHHGKRKSKCIGDKKTAEALAKELRKALAAGDLGLLQDPEPKTNTLAEYAEAYLTRMEHELKRSTWRDYSGCVRRQLVPLLGTQALSDIRPADVRAFSNSLRERGLSPLNIRKHLRVLSSILSDAVADELIASNPAIELGRSRKRRTREPVAGRKRIDPFTAEELRTLLDTARTHTIERHGEVVAPYARFHPFLLLLARTGLRLSEAIALRWGDVDWQDHSLHVERAYVQGEVAPPKSGKARRVDMSDELIRVLRALYHDRFERVVAIDAKAQAALEVERANAKDALVFPDSAGGHLDDHNLRRRVWEPLLAVAELRHRRIHDLRHSFASLLLQDGVELLYVSQQLGHATASFTLDRYAHLLPRNRRGYVNRLDSAAPAGTPEAPATRTNVLRSGPDAQNPLVSQGVL
jgi:integrase